MTRWIWWANLDEQPLSLYLRTTLIFSPYALFSDCILFFYFVGVYGRYSTQSISIQLISISPCNELPISIYINT